VLDDKSEQSLEGGYMEKRKIQKYCKRRFLHYHRMKNEGFYKVDKQWVHYTSLHIRGR
jgi:D-alanyl-D-alanine dipeptidase